MRIAVLNKKKCIAPKDCDYICMRVCPVNRTGKECIVKADDNKPAINIELCVGCGICVKKCPVKVISIENLPEELEKEQVHRFGKNGFRLYRSPIPIPNEVVGILGQNGIGKTISSEILSNQLRPNLGNLNKKMTDKEIINFFKGTEAQNHFTRLYEKGMNIAYKLQYVDAIPRGYSGKVKDLLEKNNERGMLNDLTKKLEIDKILDRDIKDISGGELQRVAVCATMLKKSDVYFFDEPSSYLDIKQRLRIAKLIRNLKDKDTAVSVIEHDLIVLDYLCDLIHIMYGKQTVYGITSHPMSCKEGINTYLEGYLRDENVRFRTSRIDFRVKPPAKELKRDTLVSWPDFQKKLGDFTLNVAAGSLSKHEVVGILGANGTGKTTFAKILTGLIKLDKDLEMKMKISYKPQYIEAAQGIVKDVIRSNLPIFWNKVVLPLKVDKILDRELKTLSGGELQSVAIACALAKEADVYLLDEPSAYLDVEQRLTAAKVIQNFVIETGKSAMVIDHDLLFLDYLSDRLLVFLGKPAIEGKTIGPIDMREGMNLFLKEIGITFRRDQQTNRPRANKEESVLDSEQKKKGEHYYI